MPKLKNLFGKGEAEKTLRSTSVDEVGSKIESADYFKRKVEEKNRFEPHVDYSDPANFAFYGSAEQYYEDAINYILNEYPYDGSLKEKVGFSGNVTHAAMNVVPAHTERNDAGEESVKFESGKYILGLEEADARKGIYNVRRTKNTHSRRLATLYSPLRVRYGGDLLHFVSRTPPRYRAVENMTSGRNMNEKFIRSETVAK